MVERMIIVQNAVIVQAGGRNNYGDIDASELNDFLECGWRVIHGAPFGCAVAEGGGNSTGHHRSAIPVIIEK